MQKWYLHVQAGQSRWLFKLGNNSASKVDTLLPCSRSSRAPNVLNGESPVVVHTADNEGLKSNLKGQHYKSLTRGDTPNKVGLAACRKDLAFSKYCSWM